MARAALKAKQWRLYEEKFILKKDVKGVKYYNRCRLCGRSRWFIRDFGVCRVCLRKYAREWKIMWLRKASW